MQHAPDPRVAVVVITRNGGHRLARTLDQLIELPERPRIVVVDNDSTDGTPELLRARYPHVRCIELGRNLAAAGRNVGVAAVEAPYVAFAEDDSWYLPGALRRTADVLDRHPAVALVNAHVLVGEDARPDPLHEDMVGPAVPDDPGLPGRRILSFLEGASIVRRDAYLAVGGFDAQLGPAGPEEHLAAELLSAGWDLRYVPEVVARHVPDHEEPAPEVRRLGLRNTLWFAWGRRRWRPALRWTVHVIHSSPPNRATVLGVLDALRGLPRVLLRRRPLPAPVERQMALLDDSKIRSRARSYGRERRPAQAVGITWRAPQARR
ncbi:MAG: glycosyltransferase [Thermoleophilaceae bacterium]|nr:glycosyltransferase [Thermoleophilaceae bacterium]